MTEPALLSTTRISTFIGGQSLTTATGFFFRRGPRLYLVTSRHVFFDESTQHFPDRIEIFVHVDPVDLTRVAIVQLPLYASGTALWKEAKDSGGLVDVAALELVAGTMPARAVLHPFGEANLVQTLSDIEAGASVLMVGFPLGFYDTVHHLPIVRQAVVASAFGVRFQGQGYFLTDARMHRGASGAPVLMRRASGDGLDRWALLGVHSARMDMNDRDTALDDSLGLNCAWYADVLNTLTAGAHDVHAPAS